MHCMVRTVGVVLVASVSGLAQSSERQKLIEQVEAADALARLVEHEAQDVPAGAAAARPGDRLPFDQVLKAATQGVSASLAGNEPADLAVLNNYQLGQALAQLHLHNQALYMQLNAKPVKDDAPDAFKSAASVQGELARSRADDTAHAVRSSDGVLDSADDHPAVHDGRSGRRGTAAGAGRGQGIVQDDPGISF